VISFGKTSGMDEINYASFAFKTQHQKSENCSFELLLKSLPTAFCQACLSFLTSPFLLISAIAGG